MENLSAIQKEPNVIEVDENKIVKVLNGKKYIMRITCFEDDACALCRLNLKKSRSEGLAPCSSLCTTLFLKFLRELRERKNFPDYHKYGYWSEFEIIRKNSIEGE